MVENNKTLHLDFKARTIQHLGVDMYQKPAAVLAEFVANSFDADANVVDITITNDKIVVQDDGCGMSFEDCQQKFLTVGVDKRECGQKKTSPSGRPLMGRKGIGKFAGFGIAKTILVETVSAASKEKTAFLLDYDTIERQGNASSLVQVENYQENCSESSGTRITLTNLEKTVKESEVIRGLGKRFCFKFDSYNFTIKINGNPIQFDDLGDSVEFSFPRDSSGSFANTEIDSCGWGKTTLADGKTFKWNVSLLKNTIKDADLRGISVFAHSKLAQVPWDFEIGAVEGQHGLSYLTGTIIADYIDDSPVDLIATERQRVNWRHEKTFSLYSTAQSFIKIILKRWAELRAERKIKKINEKANCLNQAIESLKTSDDKKVVKKAILNLAKIPTITQKQLEEMGQSIVFARKKGRVSDLIERISGMENPTESILLEALQETNFVNALNYTEVISLKLSVISELKKLIKEKALENTIRDFLSKNPWLISEELETFRVETSLNHIFEDTEGSFSDYDGKRVDLILSSGKNLILFEFMRPSKPLDEDHINRVQKYVANITAQLNDNTGLGKQLQKTYLVADDISRKPAMSVYIQSMANNCIFVLDWDTLLAQAESQYKEFIDNFQTRNPEKELMEDITKPSLAK